MVGLSQSQEIDNEEPKEYHLIEAVSPGLLDIYRVVDNPHTIRSPYSDIIEAIRRSQEGTFYATFAIFWE